jgi:hypothetical protein
VIQTRDDDDKFLLKSLILNQNFGRRADPLYEILSQYTADMTLLGGEEII